MIQSLVHLSLRFRGVVITLAALLLGYGLYTTTNAKLDVFPDFVQPQVAIQTECPGLAPEQVEALVTLPVETAVNGLGNMESLRSESTWGLSIITAVFKDGTDVFLARQMLAEKLGEVAGQMPLGVKTPRMTPLTSSTMDLLKIGLVSDARSPMELRTFADWTLKPKLLAVPGVAKCSTFGGEVRQLQIQVLPEQLIARNLSLSEVLAAARQATGVIGAGFIETDNQRIALQVEGQTPSPETLGEVVVIHRNGASVRLKDVARVLEGAEPKFGDALVQGRPGVLLTMSSQYGANTLEVTRALEKALGEMQPVFATERITVYPRLHRPATFIETALKNIQSSLLLGGVLVALVLFLLLGSVRTACISLVAIPMSLVTAVVVLERLGVSVNTITLGGLAIALGEVVDDSIIDVENIFRRLRENRTLPSPRPVLRVVLDASLEVRRAVIYATFVVTLVFLPVLTLTGLQGKFFAPLALSYILAILASLLVALTLTPALTYLLFRSGAKKAEEPRLQTWLKAGYGRLLRITIARPRLVIVIVAVLCLTALMELRSFGGSFLPDFREGHFVLKAFAIPGTSLKEMMRIGKEISDALLKTRGIATVEQQVGRAELGEDPWGPHRSELHVDLVPMSGSDEAGMADNIRALLTRIPGVQSEVLTFLGDRIDETLTGETAPVVVNIFGDDLDVLDAKAKEVAHVLRSIRGAVDVQIKSPAGAPHMAIRLRFDRLTQFGFRPAEVMDAAQTAFQGAVAAQIHQGNRVTDVVVILDEGRRREPESIGNLLVSNADGARVPLRELADIYPASGRFSIMHEGARRRQTVTCNPRGRDDTSFTEEAMAQVAARVSFPPGVYPEFSGTAEAMDKAMHQLLLHSIMAAVGILLLLAIAFGNTRNLILVLANAPFALVGGVTAVYLTALLGESGGLTMGALVGFVTLFGITTRNSIMMISHFEHLVNEEGLSWGPETAFRGAAERLLPIMMTALVTALGLLPLAIGTGEAGREIEGPMAIVILGGLLTSAALNLLVLPALALRFGHFVARDGLSGDSVAIAERRC
jgi:CzcA family heavy metal efflux pump